MRIFGRENRKGQALPPEHAVIARFRLSDDDFGTVNEREALFELEDSLRGAIEAARVGELDGHEFGGGEAVVFMYGPDADRLFSTVAALLRSHGSGPASCTLRYGPASDPGSDERLIDLRRPA